MKIYIGYITGDPEPEEFKIVVQILETFSSSGSSFLRMKYEGNEDSSPLGPSYRRS